MEVSYGAKAIIRERIRQEEAEGWTPEHDDQHSNEELARAALCYVSDYAERGGGKLQEQLWPWELEDWKPTPNDHIKQLTKAGALIAAEIDRLHRLNP